MIKCREKSQSTTKLSVHADPKIEREFQNIYRALARLDMGRFSWNHDRENKRLVLQVYNENTLEAVGLLQITEDGILSAVGTGSYSSAVGAY